MPSAPARADVVQDAFRASAKLLLLLLPPQNQRRVAPAIKALSSPSNGEGHKAVEDVLCSGLAYSLFFRAVLGEAPCDLTSGTSPEQVLCAVLDQLALRGIDVYDEDSGQPVLAEDLARREPLDYEAHCCLASNLLLVRSMKLWNPKRIVHTIGAFAPCDVSRETPTNLTDGCVLWINKVCSVVNGMVSESCAKCPTLFPLVVDEPLCAAVADGRRLGALACFHAPDLVQLDQLHFGPTADMQDAMHNLTLVLDVFSSLGCPQAFVPFDLLAGNPLLQSAVTSWLCGVLEVLESRKEPRLEAVNVSVIESALRSTVLRTGTPSAIRDMAAADDGPRTTSFNGTLNGGVTVDRPATSSGISRPTSAVSGRHLNNSVARDRPQSARPSLRHAQSSRPATAENGWPDNGSHANGHWTVHEEESDSPDDAHAQQQQQQYKRHTTTSSKGARSLENGNGGGYESPRGRGARDSLSRPSTKPHAVGSNSVHHVVDVTDLSTRQTHSSVVSEAPKPAPVPRPVDWLETVTMLDPRSPGAPGSPDRSGGVFVQRRPMSPSTTRARSGSDSRSPVRVTHQLLVAGSPGGNGNGAAYATDSDEDVAVVSGHANNGWKGELRAGNGLNGHQNHHPHHHHPHPMPRGFEADIPAPAVSPTLVRKTATKTGTVTTTTTTSPGSSSHDCPPALASASAEHHDSSNGTVGLASALKRKSAGGVPAASPAVGQGIKPDPPLTPSRRVTFAATPDLVSERIIPQPEAEATPEPEPAATPITNAASAHQRDPEPQRQPKPELEPEPQPEPVIVEIASYPYAPPEVAGGGDASSRIHSLQHAKDATPSATTAPAAVTSPPSARATSQAPVETAATKTETAKAAGGAKPDAASTNKKKKKRPATAKAAGRDRAAREAGGGRARSAEPAAAENEEDVGDGVPRRPSLETEGLARRLSIKFQEREQLLRQLAEEQAAEMERLRELQEQAALEQQQAEAAAAARPSTRPSSASSTSSRPGSARAKPTPAAAASNLRVSSAKARAAKAGAPAAQQQQAAAPEDQDDDGSTSSDSGSHDDEPEAQQAPLHVRQSHPDLRQQLLQSDTELLQRLRSLTVHPREEEEEEEDGESAGEEEEEEEEGAEDEEESTEEEHQVQVPAPEQEHESRHGRHQAWASEQAPGTEADDQAETPAATGFYDDGGTAVENPGFYHDEQRAIEQVNKELADCRAELDRNDLKLKRRWAALRREISQSLFVQVLEKYRVVPVSLGDRPASRSGAVGTPTMAASGWLEPDPPMHRPATSPSVASHGMDALLASWSAQRKEEAEEDGNAAAVQWSERQEHHQHRVRTPQRDGNSAPPPSVGHHHSGQHSAVVIASTSPMVPGVEQLSDSTADERDPAEPEQNGTRSGSQHRPKSARKVAASAKSKLSSGGTAQHEHDKEQPQPQKRPEKQSKQPQQQQKPQSQPQPQPQPQPGPAAASTPASVGTSRPVQTAAEHDDASDNHGDQGSTKKKKYFVIGDDSLDPEQERKRERILQAKQRKRMERLERQRARQQQREQQREQQAETAENGGAATHVKAWQTQTQPQPQPQPHAPKVRKETVLPGKKESTSAATVSPQQQSPPRRKPKQQRQKQQAPLATTQQDDLKQGVQQLQSKQKQRMISDDAQHARTRAVNGHTGRATAAEDPSDAASKHSHLSDNRPLCRNAICAPVCLGSDKVNEPLRTQALQALEACEGTHFIILLRDPNNMKFRGIYQFVEGSVSKIFGKGPKKLAKSMIASFMRYNSGGKEFRPIPSDDFAICDAVALRGELWPKPKAKAR